ncbi:MAG: hypothetical protein ACK4E7_03475 [Permianibacter sp.]
MTAVLSLWLPILLTAVFIFVASSLIHMVFQWHKPDYRQLPNEDEVRKALLNGKIGPGKYVMPYCTDMKAMQDEAMLNKYREGPIGFLMIGKAGMPNMGKSLGTWFLVSLLVAAIAALAAVQSIGLQADSHVAGHLIGLISLLAYGTGSVINGIWMCVPWRSVGKHLLDAVIYATISAFTFMWLWP